MLDFSELTKIRQSIALSKSGRDGLFIPLLHITLMDFEK